MPNIKSAKKRVKVIEKKTAINTARKTALKTAIKKFEAAAAAADKDAAKVLFTRTRLLERSHSWLLSLQSLHNVFYANQAPYRFDAELFSRLWRKCLLNSGKHTKNRLFRKIDIAILPNLSYNIII